nr:uncharacterized protein LOC128687578 isoform X2 [Cherax quadricarinatus]
MRFRMMEKKVVVLAVWVMVKVLDVNTLTPASVLACGPGEDTNARCILKKTQCSPITRIISGPQGPVDTLISCANQTGVFLDPVFFMSIGLAFLQGNPESLTDQVSPDSATSSGIRRCILNATGLANPDMTLNRTAVAVNLSMGFPSSSTLGAAVAAAAVTCPEPVDYRLTDFISCLKMACMNSVVNNPLMSEETSLVDTAAASSTTQDPLQLEIALGYPGAP